MTKSLVDLEKKHFASHLDVVGSTIAQQQQQDS